LTKKQLLDERCAYCGEGTKIEWFLEIFGENWDGNDGDYDAYDRRLKLEVVLEILIAFTNK
jgi:hypothetical protein